MLAVSSMSGSLSKLAQSKHKSAQRQDDMNNNELEAAPSLSSSSSSWRPAGEVEDASVYHDVSSDYDDDSLMGDDRESCGGTVLASLSSKDVRRNIEATLADSRPLEQPPRQGKRHPTELNKTSLHEIATIQSDVLSFTPTMAELALSSKYSQQQQQQQQEEDQSTDSSSQRCSTSHEFIPIPTFGIREVQPDRVACPFCDREKDLEWRLNKEREQSRELQLSGYRTQFVLVATIVTFVVAIFSFFLGKLVSDFQHEKAMNQVMAQCNAIMSQNQEEEMYWKLVTAAFSAIINAAAGPAANFIFGDFKR
jgi:hypothetical protein